MSGSPPISLVIGLSAVVVAIKDGEAVALTVRQRTPGGDLTGLPFGPFDPGGHRTFELALRAFVTEQTRFDLGYVEQLYTFGDKGRDAPLASGRPAARRLGICDRRHDLAVQGGARRGLSDLRGAAGDGDPCPFRAAGQDASHNQDADQTG